MAKSIGNYSAILSANSAAFEAGFAKATKAAEESSRAISSAAKVISGAVVGALAFAGLSGGVEKLRQTADEIDRTAKTADRLGVTTEALIGLRYAADLAGLGAEGFDSALSTMTKNVGLAAQGTGRARQALDTLGLNFQNLASVSPENQLKAIADALDAVENPTIKAALASRIFGDQGQAMLNVLAGGSKTLEEFQTRAGEINLTFSRLDAAQVEIANDALNTMTQSLSDVWRVLVIQLSPYVTYVANQITEFANSGQSVGSIVSDSLGWVIKSLAKVAEYVNIAQAAFYAIRSVATAALLAIITPVTYLIEGMSKLVQLAGDYLPQAFVDSAKTVKTFVVDLRKNLVDAGVADFSKAGDLYNEDYTGKAEAFLAGIRESSKKAAEEIAKNAPKPQPYTDAIKSFVKGPNNIAAEVKKDRVSEVRFDQNTLIRAGSAEARTFGTGLETSLIEKSINRQIELLNKQIEATKEVKQAVLDSADQTVDIGD